jgi:hypothetical protein
MFSVKKLSTARSLLTLLTVSLCALSSHLWAGPDVLVLKNGDRITGKVKKLSQAQIHFDADYGDNIFIIDWKEVERLDSEATFMVETSRGQRMTGTVKTDPTDTTKVLVGEAGQGIPVPNSEVVFLNPVDQTFWSRLGVSVDFGMSLTKANDTKQLNGRGAVDYAADLWSTSARVDVLRNAQNKVDTTKRSEIAGDFRRYFADKWFGVGSATFLQSTELGLDLRSAYIGGVGTHLVRNNRWRLGVIGGAGVTKEDYADPSLESVNSGEAVATLELVAFDIGVVDIYTTFSFLPSLTESGRIRTDFSTDFTWEIISDLFFRVGFSDNYDSQPGGGGDALNDYVFSTSVGWSY